MSRAWIARWHFATRRLVTTALQREVPFYVFLFWVCKSNINDLKEWYGRYLVSRRKIKLCGFWGFFFALVLNSGQINRNQGKERKIKKKLRCQEYTQSMTFFPGTSMWKVMFCVCGLLRGREPPMKGAARGKILCSSLNVLLKITVVYGKCWRTTALKHFFKLLHPN